MSFVDGWLYFWAPFAGPLQMTLGFLVAFTVYRIAIDVAIYLIGALFGPSSRAACRGLWAMTAEYLIRLGMWMAKKVAR